MGGKHVIMYENVWGLYIYGIKIERIWYGVCIYDV